MVLAHFVAGQRLAGSADAVTVVHDPSTGAAYETAPVGRAAELDAACRSAARAFPDWSDRTPAVRQRALLCLADAVERHAEELVDAEIRNTGKPVDQVRTGELPSIVDCLRFFAGAARTSYSAPAGEYVDGHPSMLRREPVGVV